MSGPIRRARCSLKRITFKQAMGWLGASQWVEGSGQGGVSLMEWDANDRLVVAHRAAEKVRIPVEAVAEMVFGPVLAGTQSD